MDVFLVLVKRQRLLAYNKPYSADAVSGVWDNSCYKHGVELVNTPSKQFFHARQFERLFTIWFGKKIMHLEKFDNIYHKRSQSGEIGTTLVSRLAISDRNPVGPIMVLCRGIMLAGSVSWRFTDLGARHCRVPFSRLSSLLFNLLIW